MEWHEVGAWVVAALGWAWAWTRRHRGQLLQAAAEGMAFAEKYYAGSSNQILEAEALRYADDFFPWLPQWAVVVAIRELCRRRKARETAVDVEALARRMV